MSIVYSGPSVPGGEVSPGSGSSGFTSNRVPFANTSGQLTANSSGMYWDSTQNFLGIGNTTLTTPIGLADTTGTKIQLASSVFLRVPAAKQLVSQIDGFNILTATSNSVIVGSSNRGDKLSLPSTVNATTGVGAAGSAAALPATPEVYIKVLAPNAAGTMTTLYFPAYTST